ncbi:MAG: hypothetical protein ACO265_07650 [Polynucleobacter sp.]|jgi:hypothetical protein
MEPALYPAPLGLDAAMEQPTEVEIEIEDPESLSISADGVEIIFEAERDQPEEHDANLAEYMDDRELQSIAGDLLQDFETDQSARKEWVDTYVDGLKLLGLKYEDRTEPWPGACGVFYPLLSEAAVRFQAESIMETFPASGPVKTQIIGSLTKEKEDAAERVKDDMNYRLTEEMPEYRPEHEKMLWSLALAGSAFKKVYYDPSQGRPVAIFIPAEDIVVPFGATDLRHAERITHIMRKTENEVRKLQHAGLWRDIDLGEPTTALDDIEKRKAEEQGMSATMDDRYRILEMCVDLDLPGFEDSDKNGPTGIALPYVVTIDKGTSKILAIRRNWYADDPLKLKRMHYTHYIYIPGFGFYGFGLIHLVGAFAKSGTSLIRQLVDAGTLSNLPGGLKSRGLRVKGDDTPISPGEFRDVDVPSGSIRDNILPLPYKEPSQVLYQLLQTIVAEGRRFAATADMQISDLSANTPVGTTLAVLERTLKVMSAVQARLHYSMRQEFKLLAAIIRDYTPTEYSYDVDAPGGRLVKQADYDMVDVIPVSDPNATTLAQRVTQYQAVLQLAAQAPQIYDMPELHKRMLEVLGIKNIDKLIPAAKAEQPRDPVSENMAILNMQPVKAFIYQDHEAHLAVHIAATQDPVLRQQVQQNPMGGQMMAAAMAHINEHMAFLYRKQLEQQLGVPLPPPDTPLPEDFEVEISRLAARGAQQLLQQHMAEAQQMQAQQQAQDPLIQMQQAELQLKQQREAREAAKDQADIMLKAKAQQDKVMLEQQRIQSMNQIAEQNIAAKMIDKAADIQHDRSRVGK